MSMPAGAPPPGDDRLSRIEAVTDAALARLDLADLLSELLDRVAELLDADTAAVLLLDEASGELVATAARGIEEEVRQGVRIPFGKGYAGRIAAEQKPVILDHVDHTNVLNPILREKGIQSLLGVPLLAGGTVVGVLHVGTLACRRFTDDDVSLLQLVGDRVALAVQAGLSQLQRTAATALQRSLLPPRLPAVPGLETAARYVPGDVGGVGGDWYDLFVLPSGWLCVVIGDVAGRGLQAAVIMGRLRSVLRAYALEGGDPAGILAKMDTYVRHAESELTATVLCALVEPSLGRLLVSLAGHLPPVRAQPDCPAALLDLPVDPPLGVHGDLRRRTSAVELAPGGLLFLYTDGLVETRDTPLDAGLGRLRDSVFAGPPEAVCAVVLARLVGAQSPVDDIAVLALRRTDSPAG
jgi:putative methionine-R-sulfoxide reductase with GAF domain